MAASYVYKHPAFFKGLILLASYPQKNKSLFEYAIPTISLYGSQDGFISEEEWQESRKLLPDKAIMTKITGANHAQFGSYGRQKKDNPPAISEREQQSQTALIIKDFIAQLNLRKAY
jgi:hypothetical protein